jgi:hypothetical protein
MRKVALFTFLISTSLANAESFKGIIHSVEDDSTSENRIIKLTNGRVLFSHKSHHFILNPGEGFKFKTDDEGNMISVLRLEQNNPLLEDNHLKTWQERPAYEPSIISEDELNNIWKNMNPNYKPVSECTNRAHVWSYEEFNRSGLLSQKQFVFFTASYINRHKFKWWFHVAPMIKVRVNGEVQERVLDYRYAHRPQTVKEWTDLYVHSKRPCKVTTKFSEYDVNPQTEDCYQISTPMYYWQPRDIKNEETLQKYKMSFSKSDINSAYSEAFRR